MNKHYWREDESIAEFNAKQLERIENQDRQYVRSVKWIIGFIVAMLLFSVSLPLWAQTGTVDLNWVPPTQCANNTPLTNCPIVNIKVYRGINGAVPTLRDTLLDTTLRTYRYTGLTPGTYCYYLTYSSTAGESVPSNTSCKVIAPPVVIPNPPVLTVVEVVAGVGVSPAFKILLSGSRSSAVAGFVPAGTACTGPVVFTYRGKSYRRVAQTDVKWWQTTASPDVAAACA